ncbi:MAG TPA: hypothetical protein VJP77_00235 [Planctomycetota bacterium]|nr:hypothetical protein [Planctomycetota bacterium]
MSRSWSGSSEFDSDFDADFERELDRDAPDTGRGRVREIVVRRAPSPGIAAVLSVFVPGLGHVYGGRLLAGALWFLATSFCYWAILLPGFVVHALCIWSAWRGCPDE